MSYGTDLQQRWADEMNKQGVQGLDALQAFKNQAIANETGWNLFGSTDKATAEQWFNDSAAGKALQQAQQQDTQAKALEDKIQNEAGNYQKNLAGETANIAEGSAAQARRAYASQKQDVNKQAQARGALYSGQRAGKLAGMQGSFAAQSGAIQGQAAQAAQGNLQNIQQSAQTAAIARRQLNAGKFSDALDLQKKAADLDQQRQEAVGGAVGSALGAGAQAAKSAWSF